MRSSVIESVKRILEGNVTEATLVTDQDRLKSVIGTMALTAEEVAAAGDIASVLLEPNSLYSAEKTQQARERATADVQPVIITVRNGETILSPARW